MKSSYVRVAEEREDIVRRLRLLLLGLSLSEPKKEQLETRLRFVLLTFESQKGS